MGHGLEEACWGKHPNLGVIAIRRRSMTKLGPASSEGLSHRLQSSKTTTNSRTGLHYWEALAVLDEDEDENEALISRGIPVKRKVITYSTRLVI